MGGANILTRNLARLPAIKTYYKKFHGNTNTSIDTPKDSEEK
jgi:hypothetical protein